MGCKCAMREGGPARCPWGRHTECDLTGLLLASGSPPWGLCFCTAPEWFWDGRAWAGALRVPVWLQDSFSSEWTSPLMAPRLPDLWLRR